MRHWKLIQTLLFFFLISAFLWAQYAPKQEWKQIDSSYFLLIFPSELEEDALALLPRLEQIYEMEAADYSLNPLKKWPLILTNSGMVSNGYVSLAPKKSVWYGTPGGEELTNLDWYDFLALHEVRHMVQMDFLNQGLIRALYILGGELGQTAGIFLSVPTWFFEGDAVLTETAYSKGGRGRDPLFYAQMKALALSEDFSYQKFVNRSYKDFIPNQYVFGYFMTSYIISRYGEDSWKQILESTSRLPLPALGLYRGVKELSGKSWTQLCQEMMEELESEWSQDTIIQEDLEFKEYLKQDPGDYTLYDIAFANDELIIARKQSLKDRSQLVRIQGNREKRIEYIASDGEVSSNGKTAVWTFNRPSALYPDLNWSDLVLYDLEKDKKKVLSRKGRYLNPVLSRDGQSLAVIYFRSDRDSEVQILDSDTGTPVKRYPLDAGTIPGTLSWSTEYEILFSLQSPEGRGLCRMSLLDGSMEKILPASMETIKRVQKWKDYILYTSNANGFESIIALHPETGKRFSVIQSGIGIRSLYVPYDGNQIFFTIQTNKSGYQPVSLLMDPDLWTTLETVDFPVPYSGEGEALFESLDSQNANEIKVQDYSPSKQKWNLHSWGFSPNLESMTGLRLHIQSSDLMDHFLISAGGEYEINENAFGAFLDIDWKQFYPFIYWRNSAFFKERNTLEYWDLSSRFSLAFPMNFKRDAWSFSLNPSLSSGFRGLFPIEGESLSYIPIGYGFLASAYLPGSIRALNPLWGVTERSAGSADPARLNEVFQIFTDTKVYVPGLFRNSGLTVNGAYEKQSGHYSLGFPFARGYESVASEGSLKWSVDYDIPLAYPDLALGSFLYIKRIRGNLFYDQLWQETGSFNNLYRSAGAEINIDMTAANQVQGEINLGLRFSWLVDEERPVFQLIFLNSAF